MAHTANQKNHPVSQRWRSAADLDLEAHRRLQVEAEHPVVVVAAEAVGQREAGGDGLDGGLLDEADAGSSSLFARMPALKDDAGLTNGELGGCILAGALALFPLLGKGETWRRRGIDRQLSR